MEYSFSYNLRTVHKRCVVEGEIVSKNIYVYFSLM